MRYDALDPIVLVAVSRGKAQQNYLLSDHPEFYHFGIQRPKWFGDQRLRYFAPYIAQQGFNCYFEILGYEMKPRNAIYPIGSELHERGAGDSGERLVVRSGTRTYIHDRSFFQPDANVPYFRYTYLSHIRSPRNGKVQLVLSEEIPTAMIPTTR